MSDGGTKKRLGRGLAALIGEMDDVSSERDAKNESAVRADRTVPIEHLRASPNNPRRHFSEEHLADLARSVAEKGIVQPILVRPVKDGDGPARYEIIAGERRWRAAQKAALHEVPVIIREVGDREALELAIIENVQRADLDPLEEAMGYQQLIDEHAYSQADLGNVIGKSRSHVANTLRLLKLPDEIRQLVSDGSLSAGHARTLVTSNNPLALARRIIEGGLSVRQAEELAQRELTDSPAGKSGKAATGSRSEADADTRAAERALEEALGMKAQIRHTANGKGELRIRYSSLDQLEEVCRRLEGR